jgi:cation diffusion facilitator CzcD-associated flavoprotein CzcO
MAPISQPSFSLLGFSTLGNESGFQHALKMNNGKKKSIAIIGAGTGGLAVLQAMLNLPLKVRENWEIITYESRRDIGGVWLVQLWLVVHLPEVYLQVPLGFQITES